MIRPLWESVAQVVKGEERIQGRPLLQEEREEAVGVALAPLLTLLSTFQGNDRSSLEPFPFYDLPPISVNEWVMLSYFFLPSEFPTSFILFSFSPL